MALWGTSFIFNSRKNRFSFFLTEKVYFVIDFLLKVYLLDVELSSTLLGIVKKIL